MVEKTGALSPSDSIQTAGDRMRSAEANAWPVAEGRKLVGVIDQADPDRQAGGHGHDPSSVSVGDTMRHEAIFCYEDQNAAEADRIMRERNVNHLPVVDREMKIVGIISREDVKGAEQQALDAAAREKAAPAEDWKPGESQGAEDSSPEASEGDDEDKDPVPESRSADDGEEVVDHERFPFRAPAESADVR